MYPITFEPIIKRARWGGRRLGTELGKPLGDETDYAESWELADHGDDQTVVANGTFGGLTLGQLVADHNETLFGQHGGMTQFPLLIKFLDANDWLSLQVHPNDDQAKTYDPAENGKTEAWIILDAEPGSQIVSGLKPGIDRATFEAHLQDESLEDDLHRVEVQPGDCVFVPAGTAHAIGGGILLAEVQQQSDITFRLHDWGRMGSDGKPRQIHIQESLDCIAFDRGPVDPVQPSEQGPGHEELVRGEYFVIQRRTGTAFDIETDNRFHILIGLDGSGSVTCDDHAVLIERGRTVLLPAACSTTSVRSEAELTLLDVFVP